MRKSIVYFIAAFVMILTASCGASKTNTNKSDTNQVVTLVENEPVNYSSKESVKSAHEPNAVAMNNGTTGGNSNMSLSTNTTSSSSTSENDYSEMYSQLNMTDDQIQTLNSALEDFKERQRNTPNGEMMGTVADEQRRQLKDILTPEQFTVFEDLSNEY
ncbi:hypothetical protein JQC67_00465 [Aurantibacter crassamenti]|uniref:hypothetical protein n=1 Tax=Aurantibacter crassamenti TaxID=1837375 RepID=UPI0019396D40|nr:hypothetical protein [Aurantibacter crassamenti]MBM1104597.1 hypothetical protein [Aurantibacter crassamenti]